MIKFKIKEIRRDKGISQQELAHMTNLNRSYISKIERNINNKSLTLHTFLSIMTALEVQPSEIFEFCDNCKYKQSYNENENINE